MNQQRGPGNAVRTLLVISIGLPIGCSAARIDEPSSMYAQHVAEGGHDWRAEPHHLSILGGSTIDDETSAFTLGLDYEYRRSDLLGLGAVVEHAFTSIDATTLLAVTDVHFTPHCILQTGPGIEFIDDVEEFVYRIGVLYEWEVRGYTLSPQLHYDASTGEDAVILALAVGFGF